MTTIFLLTLAAALLIVSAGIVAAATVEQREARKAQKRLSALRRQSHPLFRNR